MGLLFSALDLAIEVFYVAILLSVIFSLLRMFGLRISRYNPVVRIIEDIADLLLRPIRTRISATAGGLDFSPMIALVLLYLVQQILHQARGRLG